MYEFKKGLGTEDIKSATDFAQNSTNTSTPLITRYPNPKQQLDPMQLNNVNDATLARWSAGILLTAVDIVGVYYIIKRLRGYKLRKDITLNPDREMVCVSISKPKITEEEFIDLVLKMDKMHRARKGKGYPMGEANFFAFKTVEDAQGFKADMHDLVNGNGTLKKAVKVNYLSEARKNKLFPKALTANRDKEYMKLPVPYNRRSPSGLRRNPIYPEQRRELKRALVSLLQTQVDKGKKGTGSKFPKRLRVHDIQRFKPFKNLNAALIEELATELAKDKKIFGTSSFEKIVEFLPIEKQVRVSKFACMGDNGETGWFVSGTAPRKMRRSMPKTRVVRKKK